jgi:hypothetical protein
VEYSGCWRCRRIYLSRPASNRNVISFWGSSEKSYSPNSHPRAGDGFIFVLSTRVSRAVAAHRYQPVRLYNSYLEKVPA